MERKKRELERKQQTRVEWAKKLLERRIDDFQNSAEGHLLAAAEKNSAAEVLAALRRDPDLNFKTDDSHQYPGYTALHFAAYHGNADIALALLMCGAKIGVYEKYGYTPLHLSTISEQRVSDSR